MGWRCPGSWRSHLCGRRQGGWWNTKVRAGPTCGNTTVPAFGSPHRPVQQCRAPAPGPAHWPALLPARPPGAVGDSVLIKSELPAKKPFVSAASAPAHVAAIPPAARPCLSACTTARPPAPAPTQAPRAPVISAPPQNEGRHMLGGVPEGPYSWPVPVTTSVAQTTGGGGDEGDLFEPPVPPTECRMLAPLYRRLA